MTESPIEDHIAPFDAHAHRLGVPLNHIAGGILDEKERPTKSMGLTPETYELAKKVLEQYSGYDAEQGLKALELTNDMSLDRRPESWSLAYIFIDKAFVGARKSIYRELGNALSLPLGMNENIGQVFAEESKLFASKMGDMSLTNFVTNYNDDWRKYPCPEVNIWLNSFDQRDANGMKVRAPQIFSNISSAPTEMFMQRMSSPESREKIVAAVTKMEELNKAYDAFKNEIEALGVEKSQSLGS